MAKFHKNQLGSQLDLARENSSEAIFSMRACTGWFVSASHALDTHLHQVMHLTSQGELNFTFSASNNPVYTIMAPLVKGGQQEGGSQGATTLVMGGQEEGGSEGGGAPLPLLTVQVA